MSADVYGKFLRAALEDPGTGVATAIASTLQDATTPAALEFRERLRDNPSAYVRTFARAESSRGVMHRGPAPSRATKQALSSSPNSWPDPSLG
jgi:hypothetical protein